MPNYGTTNLVYKRTAHSTPAFAQAFLPAESLPSHTWLCPAGPPTHLQQRRDRNNHKPLWEVLRVCTQRLERMGQRRSCRLLEPLLCHIAATLQPSSKAVGQASAQQEGTPESGWPSMAAEGSSR